MRRLAILPFALAAACGSDNDQNRNDASNHFDASTHDAEVIPDAFEPPDSSMLPDASVPPDTSVVPDASNVTCLIANMLGTVTPIDPTATANDPAAPSQAEFDAALNTDALPDLLALQLWAGYGVFMNDETVGPVSVSLSGAESSYDTCGACVLLFADVDPNNGPAAFYMPTTGTLDITSTTGNFTGTLTNATLVHVDIDPDTLATTPAPDGCTTSITSMTFDTPIATMFAPKPLRLRKKH